MEGAGRQASIVVTDWRYRSVTDCLSFLLRCRSDKVAPTGSAIGGLGVHAGPGTPDIQEILVCATGSKSVREAIETNLAVHKELRNILEKEDSSFTNGRGDEGGWAPKLGNEQALELSAKACENLGYTLGKEVSLGVDFASSTQWNDEKKMYVYDRAGFENSP